MSIYAMMSYVGTVMGVMVQRCTVMLAARPYVCNYRDFLDWRQFRLSLNWTLFVIFDYDNLMTRVGGWNINGIDASGHNRSM